MYCINCGVKLADTEQQCPLCGTVPYHPELTRPEAERLYPRDRHPERTVSPWGSMLIVSLLFLVPLLVTLLCDLEINGSITWSGYVTGALAVCYVVGILPFWFRRPNPVIFVPCGFAAVGLYLLYINFYTGGGWFLSFAFPLVGFLGLVVTAVVALLRYVRRGKLYIYGGAFTAIGAFMPLMEFLLMLTFRLSYVGWSIFPLGAFVLLGGFLIFLAICRPAREAMERKFFL